jgi:MYXO-CTERM domain-containing protein
VAGSANADIVTLNTGNPGSIVRSFDPTIGSTLLTFNPFGNSTDNAFGDYSYAWGNGATFQLGLGITKLLPSTGYPYNSNVTSVEYSFDGTNWINGSIGNVTSSFPSSFGTLVTVGAPNASALMSNFRWRVTLPTASNYTLGTTASISTGSQVRVSVLFNNTSQGGQGTVTVAGPYAVPAPGALALLGVAGVVGARRRRA